MRIARASWSVCALLLGVLSLVPAQAKPAARGAAASVEVGATGGNASETKVGPSSKAPGDEAKDSKAKASKTGRSKGDRAKGDRAKGGESRASKSGKSKDRTKAGEAKASKSGKSNGDRAKDSATKTGKERSSKSAPRGEESARSSKPKARASVHGPEAGERSPSGERRARRSTSSKQVRVAPADRPPVAKPKGSSDPPESDKGAKARSRSIGAPNHGRLSGGAKLEPTKRLLLAPGSQRWAVPELVGALKRTASVMARQYNSPPVFVGDLSAERGGKLGPHRSHQSGRDVDIGFFATDTKGRSVKMSRFVAFDGKGRARDGSGLKFDDKRNWGLVRALIEDREIRVRYMFITQELEDRLIAYATARKAKRQIVARAAEVMQSPADVDLHDNHIHMRIDCPAASRGVCVAESIQHADALVAGGSEPNSASGGAQDVVAGGSSAADPTPDAAGNRDGASDGAPVPVGAATVVSAPATPGLSPGDI